VGESPCYRGGLLFVVIVRLPLMGQSCTSTAMYCLDGQNVRMEKVDLQSKDCGSVESTSVESTSTETVR